MIAGHRLMNQICNIVRSCDNSVAYYCCKHLSAYCKIIVCSKQNMGLQHSMQTAISLPNLSEVKYRERERIENSYSNEWVIEWREREREADRKSRVHTTKQWVNTESNRNRKRRKRKTDPKWVWAKQRRVYSVQMCVGVWMIIALWVCVCVCVNRVCGMMSSHVFCCRISYTYSVNSHYSLCTESLLVISFSGSLPLSSFPPPVRGKLSMTARFTLEYLNFQSRNKQNGRIMRDSLSLRLKTTSSHTSAEWIQVLMYMNNTYLGSLLVVWRMCAVMQNSLNELRLVRTDC